MITGLADRGITRETAERFDVFPLSEGMGFPMYLGGRVVGYQAYHPNSSDKRYVSYGQRGIGTAASNVRGTIICEGIFDALSLWELFYTSVCGLTLRIYCTFGNQITREQLTEVLYLSSHQVPMFVAFDSDKPSELAQACCMLKPYRKVVGIPPILERGDLGGAVELKDWDEAVRLYPEATIEFWKDIFERHA